MKILLLTIIFLVSLSMFSQEDYQLNIDGKTTPIALDTPYQIKVGKKMIDVTLSIRDTLTYSDSFLQFSYPNSYKVSEMELEQGITQKVLMTAEGSGFMVQEYTNLDPSMMQELLLKEVTKESKEYGYTEKREDYERTVRSGQTLKVLRSVLTYKDDIAIYEISSFSKKDEGLLLMTIDMNVSENGPGKRLINMIWDSIEFK
tara:strand:- start:13554 stop:14159 length:606 start_codon:yes stop_codon:yes gene_type:complete